MNQSNKALMQTSRGEQKNCEHIWAVRNHKERRYLLDGDFYLAYTVYYCTKCLETKTVTED